MSELELIELVSGASERIWGLIEFWVSVSFAAIVAVHYSSNRVNGALASIVTILYTAFTLMVFTSMGAHSDNQTAAYELLAVLEAKENLTAIGEQTLEYSRSERVQKIYAFTFMATYFGTVGYVVYSYFSRRKQASDAT
jgi:hypothetical protein